MMHHAYTIARSVACRVIPLARHMSSKPNAQTPLPNFALPPKKLRALVSLYHQSNSFITPENLDEEIDRAFLEVPAMRTFGNRRVDWPSLRLEVKERKQLSKFGLPETLNSALSMYEAGYEEREKRVEQVFDAMYGTWQTNKPGLELLQDTWEGVEQRLKGEEGVN
ncbi:hypothetical protein B0F90DRAFT_250355 [Multifurca ochricompacta]|uniref:Uncharacterized protein n=1 Tax=Multifurca ochricompacta TaxID=376703 RepID=A0AAD4M5C4_9AGAM|nr:hypothetical protein B0F90DRAFT_250355 [Multifurca ochricompacta]